MTEMIGISEVRMTQMRQLATSQGLTVGKLLDRWIAGAALAAGVDIPGFEIKNTDGRVDLSIAGYPYTDVTPSELRKLIFIAHRLGTEGGIQAAYIADTMVMYQRRGLGIAVIVDAKEHTHQIAEVVLPWQVVLDFTQRIARMYKEVCPGDDA